MQLGEDPVVLGRLRDVPITRRLRERRVADEIERATHAKVDEDPLLAVVPIAVVVAEEAATARRNEAGRDRVHSRARGALVRIGEPQRDGLDRRRIEESLSVLQGLGRLRDRAVRRAQVREDARADLLRCREVAGLAAEVRHAAQTARGGEARVREVLLLAVPVHLPDARVRGDEAARLLELHEHVGDLALHDREDAGRERGVLRRGDVLVERPEEQPEAVELDVRSVRVGVALLGAVAVVANDRDLVRRADVRLVAAHRRAELELQRLLRFGVVTGAHEPDGRVRHVANPRDVPLAGRDAREDLTVALARLGHLAHPKEGLRLRKEARFGGRQPRRSRRAPAGPRCDFVVDDLLRRAAREERAHAVDRRLSVGVEREDRVPPGPHRRVDRDVTERLLEPRDLVVLHRDAVVVEEVAAAEEGAIGSRPMMGRRDHASVAHREPTGAPLVERVARSVVREAFAVRRRVGAPRAELVVHEVVRVDRTAARETRDLDDVEHRALGQADRREVELLDAETRDQTNDVDDAGALDVLGLRDRRVGEPRRDRAHAHAGVRIEHEVARLDPRLREPVGVLQELGEAVLAHVERDRRPAVRRREEMGRSVRLGGRGSARGDEPREDAGEGDDARAHGASVGIVSRLTILGTLA